MTMFGNAAPRRLQYYMLPIAAIIDETPTARSLVFEVPPRLRRDFQYQAGQFLTVRLRLGPDHYIRCYSMSSSPATDDTIKITVKRVPDGVVSNFFNDMLKVGYRVEAMPPSGEFVLDPGAGDRGLVFLSSGSGITPVISMVKTALATTGRHIRLLYANQSRDSIIFRAELDDLVQQYPGRLEVVHHIYDEVGYIDQDLVTKFVGDDRHIDVYVCGSRHFMATAQEALEQTDLPSAAIRYERFSSAAIERDSTAPTVEEAAAMAAELGAASLTETVNIKIRGGEYTLGYHKGDTLIEVARSAHLNPPFSCEGGICGACMARVTEGDVTMIFNRALHADEVEQGWTLTCRAIPVSPTVSLEYPD